MVLLDTNVLVYAADRTAAFHQAARTFRDQAARGQQAVCVSPSVLNEFYAVVTDDKRVQRPLTPQAALNELRVYRNVFPVIHPGDSALNHLRDLIERYGIQGPHVFDAWIVATMLEHGVETIYTTDRKHFGRFREIQVVGPDQ